MSKIVFDSPVYLAILFGEPVHPSIIPLQDRSFLSAVNFAEILTKIKQVGTNSTDSFHLLNRVRRIKTFTRSQARIAADLRVQTSHAGLSFLDSACLALDIELGADVYTADRMWSKVQVPCKIHLVR